jgi:hypothetical protein
MEQLGGKKEADPSMAKAVVLLWSGEDSLIRFPWTPE